MKSAPWRTEIAGRDQRSTTDIAMKVRSGDSISRTATWPRYHAGVERHQAGAGDRVGGRPVALAQADLGPDERAPCRARIIAVTRRMRREVALVVRPAWRRRARRCTSGDAADPGGAAHAQHALPVEGRAPAVAAADGGRRRRRRDRRTRGVAGRSRGRGRPAVAAATVTRGDGPAAAGSGGGVGATRPAAGDGTGSGGRRRHGGRLTARDDGAASTGGGGAAIVGWRVRRRRRADGCRRPAAAPGWTPGPAPGARRLHPRLGPGEPLDPGIERPDGVLERRRRFRGAAGPAGSRPAR